MKYQGNYRLTDNPRAKGSHKLRAMMRLRERQALEERMRKAVEKGGVK